MNNDRPLVIAVDFDGTIVEQNGMYPTFGPALPMAFPALRSMSRDNRYSVYIYSLRDTPGSSSTVKSMANNFLIDNKVKVSWACDAMCCVGKFPYDILIDDRAYPNKQNDRGLWPGVIYKLGLTIKPSTGEPCLFNMNNINIPEYVKDDLTKEAIDEDVSMMLATSGDRYILSKLSGQTGFQSFMFDSTWHRSDMCSARQY